MAENERKEEMKEQMNQSYGFAPDIKLKECKYCRVLIPKKAKICPNCKMRLKKRWLRNFFLLMLLLAVIALGVAGGYYYFYVYQVPAATSVAVISGYESEDNSGEIIKEDNVAKETDIVAEAQEEKQETEFVAPVEEVDAEKAENGQNNEQEITMEEEKDTPDEESADEADETILDSSEQDNVEQNNEETIAINLPLQMQESESQEIAEEAGQETDKDVESFKESCEQVSYKAMLRQTEDYLNTPLMIEVTVVAQIDGGLFDENIYYLCVEEDKNGIDRYYIIRDDRTEDTMLILEGDVLCIYGTLFDRCILPADVIKTRPVVPAIAMRYCELLEE